LEKIISELMNNPTRLKIMGENAKRVYSSQFGFEFTYQSLVEDLEKIAKKGIL